MRLMLLLLLLLLLPMLLLMQLLLLKFLRVTLQPKIQLLTFNVNSC